MLFVRDDWRLFCDLTTLCQKAGVKQKLLAALVVKEIVDNALDAGARVTLQKMPNGRILINDDGPGIPGDNDALASLFSVRRPLTSSKLVRLPTRGALGNGLRVVAGAILASGGELLVGTRGRTLKLTPRLDGGTSWEWYGDAPGPGTHVSIMFGPALAEQDALWMGNLAIQMRGNEGYTGKTSAWWYDSDSFHNLFLAAGATPAKDVIALFDKAHRYKEGRKLVAPAEALSPAETEALLVQLRDVGAAPAHAKLGSIGEHAFRCHGYSRKWAELRIRPTRGQHEAIIPVVIECWATQLGKDENPWARIYVNRTPITAEVSAYQNEGREGKMAIRGCGMHYWCKTGKIPQSVRIAVTAPYMPVTTDGKEPDLGPIDDAIIACAELATGKAKRAVAALSDAAVETPMKDLIVELLPQAIRDASGNGRMRFSLRFLYYAMRPLVQRAGRKEPSYNYFCTVISQFESDQGHDIKGMYRDPRGVLIHPHTRERIELGTLNIEQYERPKWRFNKVLYIEKGGFTPLLEDEKWGERHDCVIMHAQGQATRAVKDVIDLLGDTLNDEPLEFFCVHDADGYGTLIYERLVEGSLARPGRKVKVTNLGLDPWEAVDMGLLPEDVETKNGSIPVADYVRNRGRYWVDFLQKQRVELNAMTAPQFVEWLDEKMAQHSRNEKVIPPDEVLEPKFRADAHKGIYDGLVAEAVARLGIKARAEQLATLADIPYDLRERVERHLRETPADSWEKGMEPLVDESVRDVIARFA
jgi:hypothetical protein